MSTQEPIAGVIDTRPLDLTVFFEQSIHNTLHSELSKRGVPLGQCLVLRPGCDHEEIVPVPLTGKLNWGVTDYGKVLRFTWTP